MSDLLFDPPWWLWAIPAAAGIFLLLMGNTRQNKHLLRIGAAMAAFAALIFLISWIVDTPKEKAVAGSRALIRQIAAADWPAARSHLASDAMLIAAGERILDSADRIIASARKTHEQFRLTGVTILHLEPPAGSASPIILSIKVLSQHDLPGVSAITSSWEFEWTTTPTGLHLARIRLLDVNGVSMDNIRSRIPVQ